MIPHAEGRPAYRARHQIGKARPPFLIRFVNGCSISPHILGAGKPVSYLNANVPWLGLSTGRDGSFGRRGGRLELSMTIDPNATMINELAVQAILALPELYGPAAGTDDPPAFRFHP
jgi:hypothetical protein